MLNVVAIHQPNFFPWLGYFNKMAKCNTFILLDNVQFQKKGGNYVNRVKIIINNIDAWLTIPIKRNYHGTKQINEIEINNENNWQKKMLETIRMNYSKSLKYHEIIDMVESMINQKETNLSTYNINIIKIISKLLGYEHKLVIASEVNSEGKSTELLISLTQSVNGTAYICGGGSAKYQDDAMFKEAGLELIKQNFEHPVYLQHGTNQFIPGLSILDALFNCGIDRTKKLIENCERQC